MGPDLARGSDSSAAADADAFVDAGATGADATSPMDAGPSAGAWTRLAPMPGGPRQETSVVELDGEIYVLGGFDGSAQVLTAVEAYDPANDRWRARADLPFAMHHMNAATIDGRIYVVGALTGLGFVENPNVIVYDPALDRWEARGEMPAGLARGSAGVAVIGSKMFLAGGYRDRAAVVQFTSYDTLTGEFEVLPELPAALDHLASVAASGVVYVIGGRSGSIAATTASVWSFEPAVGIWRARASMPRPRAGFAGATVLEGRVYVFGGEGNPDSGSQGVFADADVYDPGSDRWHMVAPMRTPRHGTAAAALGDRIFVPGGATQQAFGAVATNEAFVP